MEKFYVAIDIGGTNTKIALVKNNKIIKKTAFKTQVYRGFEFVFNDLIANIESLINSANFNIINLVAIGAGVPGAVDTKKGVVIFNTLGWKNIPLETLLADKFNVKVKIANDANLAALGEAHFGAGKNYKNVLLLTLGTGVGGGIIINGKLYDGTSGFAGEIGHIVISKNGINCNCGRSGCFEKYASVKALVEQTKAAMENNKQSLLWKVAPSLDEVNGLTAFNASKLGDSIALSLVNNYINYLSVGITNLCNVLRPDMVLIGGGICEAGDDLLVPLKTLVNKTIYGGVECAPVEIKFATLGNDAGLLGAYHMVKTK